MGSPTLDEQLTSDFSYCHHLVAFLDLQGQTEKLKRIDGFLKPDQLAFRRDCLNDTLKETIGTIWAFRKSFLSFFNAYLNHPTTIPIPMEIEHHFTQLRSHSEIKLQSFSDSTIVWTPIQASTGLKYAQALNSIHGILTSIGSILPLFLSREVAVRGGIDIEGGISITPGGNEIYGPALNRAYVLESKKAQYPRVLVGDGLLDFLDSIGEAPFDDQVVKSYCQAMAHRCRRWIVIDDDRMPMIHFLGAIACEIAQEALENNKFYHEVLEPMGAFIVKSEKSFYEAGNKRLAERYSRLKSYYEKHIGDWK